MPVQKTKKASTGVQQSLKSTWTNSTKKAAAPGEKKTITKSSAVVSAVPAAPKRTVKKKRSATVSSAEESEIESISSESESESESDKDEVESVESFDEIEEAPAPAPAPVIKKKQSNKQLVKAVEVDSSVHTKGETRAQKVLRKFDLSYEYGPCVGVSRLERWKRAEDLGLEPPVEVRDMLTSGEGGEAQAENVFHGHV